MTTPDLRHLKYGIIYIYCDPERMALLRGSAALLGKIVHPMDIEWVDDPGREGALLAARRFNVGNIGQYATVSLRTSQYNSGGGQMRALHRFTEALMGLGDPVSGDIVIDEDDYAWGGRVGDACSDMMDEARPCAAPQDHTRVAKTHVKRSRSFKRRLQDLIVGSDDEPLISQECDEIVSYQQSVPVPDELQEQEDLELKEIERERYQALERIRRDIVNYIALYHDDPKELMAELLRGKIIVGQPGRVLVNGDMKIVLPEYDEMEIEMPAMCRTLYILFMKQRKQGTEGIVLKNMDEYRDEIIDIYGLVKPGASEQRVARSVDNLCDPMNDALNQTISRINRCIRNVITDGHLAHDYCITGERGQQYGILLDPQYLELPRAVTGA